ncbi:MAG: hypothetical protein DI565_00670 [Ancylobacter novellus]|uniref:Uncharacterized protein n=1 Tax=Ancylobacter novellus TaxID=921 RepID=A0A2W5KPK1_ANCNO|nr:MAG: hypothetical protein DI565_00670 [Ancylobacter novellus]
MKSFAVVATFYAYPDGRTKELFEAGRTYEREGDFVDLVVGKGLAEAGGGALPVPDALPAGDPDPEPETDPQDLEDDA